MIYYKNECNNFEYEFEDILKLFFNKDEIKKIEGPWDKDSGAFLFCRFEKDLELRILIDIRESSGKYYEQTSIPVSDAVISINSNLNSVKSQNEYNLSAERDLLKKTRKTFKRKLFILLQNYTGKVVPWGVMTGIRPAKLVNEFLDMGYDKEHVIKALTEDYFVSENKAQLLYEVAVNQRELFMDSASDTVSLYIGIPFCPTRCLYCSFSSSTIGQYKKVVDLYLEALLKEIKHTQELIRSRGQRIESIYIGGGTPTSINPIQLGNLLQGIEAHLDLSSLMEYTLEAGRPDTIDTDKLKIIKNSRVSRISINPQTMNASTLERIGRYHTPEEVERAFYTARELGFDNINMDVICGLPGENIKMFENTMVRIKKLKPQSLTVHTIAIKRASRLNLEMDNYSLIREYDQVAEMVETAREYASDMGMEPYYLYRQKNILGNLENVGYSLKGRECLYNIQIMEERQSIYACGAGAVTKIVFPENRIERVFNVKSVEEYLARIDEMNMRKEQLLVNSQ